MKTSKIIFLIVVNIFVVTMFSYSQYKLTEDGELKKILKISSKNNEFHDFNLKNADGSHSIGGDLVLVKSKSSTKLYIQCVSSAAIFDISDMAFLIKLSNGKIYTSKPERTKITENMLGQKMYYTYFVIDQSFSTIIAQFGISKIRFSYKSLFGDVKLDYNFDNSETNKLKDEIKYCVSKSFETIKKENDKTLENNKDF